MTLLDVRDLRVEFPTDTETVAAVRGLSYHVDAGEVVALVGESGRVNRLARWPSSGYFPNSRRCPVR